jgi:hypothetical protein
MDYAAHIARICKIESITLHIYSGNGRAYRKSRRIKIRPVKTAKTYAVALHEIGHILGPRQSSTRLDQEVGAWEWAERNALEWTPAMSATRARCLNAYLVWSLRRRGVKQAGPDHPIHALIAA